MIDEKTILAGAAFHEGTPRGMTSEWPIDSRRSGLRSPIRELAIAKVVRPMRGRSGAYLIQANDGQHYVAKFQQNPKGTRTLVNELLGSVILRALGLPSAEGVTLRLDEAILPEGDWPTLETPHGRVRARAGLHFGSAFPGISGKDAIYDYLPKSMRDSVTNREALNSAQLVDTWLGLSEPRQAIFARAEDRKFRLILVDNSMLFGGARWAFSAQAGQARYFDPSFYPDEASYPSDARIAQVVNMLTKDRSEIVQQVPKEWLAGDEFSLQTLLNELVERAALSSVDRALALSKAPRKSAQSQPFVGGESSDAASASAKSAMEAAS